MSAQPKYSMTEADYLAQERVSIVKHEYYAGKIFAMVGASEQHNIIASNVNASFYVQLRGRGCRIYPSDMRVKILQTGLYTYPDITLVCSKPEFTDAKKRDTLLNPLVIIEILSPSTERYDRGMKFQHYRTIESLQEYILIAQDAYSIEQYTRHEKNKWILTEAAGINASITLSSLTITLSLADAYEQVEFPTPSPATITRDIRPE